MNLPQNEIKLDPPWQARARSGVQNKRIVKNLILLLRVMILIHKFSISFDKLAPVPYLKQGNFHCRVYSSTVSRTTMKSSKLYATRSQGRKCGKTAKHFLKPWLHIIGWVATLSLIKTRFELFLWISLQFLIGITMSVVKASSNKIKISYPFGI